MGDVALADGASMEAGGPFLGAEDFAVGTVTVTPVEAGLLSVAAHVPSMAVDAPSVEGDVPTVAADVASVVGDVVTVEADVPTVEGDVASVVVGTLTAVADMPPVAADVALVEAAAEAVTEADAGRFITTRNSRGRRYLPSAVPHVGTGCGFARDLAKAVQPFFVGQQTT
jgi:hypothetical protein